MGPVIAGGVKLPAHTPMVIGVSVAELAARVVGTLLVSNCSPFPVDGQLPETSVLVTKVLSGAVPWLSMQKNSCWEGPPAVTFQNIEVGLEM